MYPLRGYILGTNAQLLGPSPGVRKETAGATQGDF